MKQAFLFKSPHLTVHEIAGQGDGTASAAKAILKSATATILLDAAATEVLVGYLRIMRAYFTAAHRSKHLLSSQLEQVSTHLEKCLAERGSTVAKYGDIRGLIQDLGCLHDWVMLHSEPQHA